MTNYMFETSTTMKEYNAKKWWIDTGIIRPTIISAENLKEAMRLYVEYAEKSCIDISENAIRTKTGMYVDTKNGSAKQVGYVITGKTEMQRENGSWSTQYVDLWVRISEVNDVDFEEA